MLNWSYAPLYYRLSDTQGKGVDIALENNIDFHTYTIPEHACLYDDSTQMRQASLSHRLCQIMTSVTIVIWP